MDAEANKEEVVEQEELDSNAKDIMKKASKELKLSDAEIKKLLDEINENFDFNKMLEELKKKYPLQSNKYVIFTDGKEQLYYENGEFFLISSVDSTKQKRKIKRKEALDLYNEYYITNILNPLIKQKNKVEPKKEVVKKEVPNKEAIVHEEKVEEKVKPEKEKAEKQKKQEKEVEKTNDEAVKKVNEQSVESIESRLEELKAKEKRLKQEREKSKDNITR